MSEEIQFRKPKKKMNVRQKMESEETGEEDDDGLRRLEDVRELQRTRERRHGLSAVECAFGKARAAELGGSGTIEGGDELQLSGRQRAQLQAQGIEAGIREQFEKETLLRDEDEELRKYIEKGLKGSASEKDAAGPSQRRGEKDEILQRAANRMKGGPAAEERELLSNQMLAGIPEVDLGINARMTNIVETERKKKNLLELAMRKAMGLPEPVPEEDPEIDRKRRRRGPL